MYPYPLVSLAKLEKVANFEVLRVARVGYSQIAIAQLRVKRGLP